MPDSISHPQRLLFVSGCLFTEASGPYQSLKQTAEHLVQRGHEVTVMGTRHSDDPAYPSHWSVNTHAFRRVGPPSLHFAPSFRPWIERQTLPWDIISIQGVWFHVSEAAVDWCLRHDRPYMITVHGNFNPQALRISAWKKWLARKTFMRKVLQHVNCYQALTMTEYETLRTAGVRQPICVIGNGIQCPDLDALPEPKGYLQSELLHRRTCLYLGRLSPIKGIERLLDAWACVAPTDDWQLVIAGSGDDDYVAGLQNRAYVNGCRNVRFVGFVTGVVKSLWLRQADFFVLSSLSEAFPMAVLEAFAHRTPALLTNTCGLPEVARAGAAIEVPSSEAGLQDGLVRIMSLPSAEISAMGQAGYELVSTHYAWDAICDQLESVYAWLHEGGEPPKVVLTN